MIALNAVSTLYAQAGPTPEEYVSKVGGDARIVPVGQLQIDGNKLVCGQRPTVLDNSLDDYGAAYPGFHVILKRLKLDPIVLVDSGGELKTVLS